MALRPSPCQGRGKSQAVWEGLLGGGEKGESLSGPGMPGGAGRGLESLGGVGWGWEETRAHSGQHKGFPGPSPRTLGYTPEVSRKPHSPALTRPHDHHELASPEL